MSDLVTSFSVNLHEQNINLSGTIYQRDYIKSWIIIVNGGGNTHERIHNIKVAKDLAKDGHACFLIDLLGPDEESRLENRTNLTLLSSRLLMATRWLMNSKYYHYHTPIGYFGAQVGAAVALTSVANFAQNNIIYAIVSHSGRLDLVDEKILSSVFTPTLMITSSEEREEIESNKIARESLLNCRLYIVPHANYHFEVPGAIDEAVKLTIEWFDNHVPQIAEYVD